MHLWAQKAQAHSFFLYTSHTLIQMKGEIQERTFHVFNVRVMGIKLIQMCCIIMEVARCCPLHYHNTKSECVMSRECEQPAKSHRQSVLRRCDAELDPVLPF